MQKQAGVTLIELLVVLVIMGVLLTLVGPFTVDMVDKGKARNEQLELVRWLKSQSFKAFNRNQAMQFKMDDSSITRVSINAGQAEATVELSFEFIYFQQQTLNLNHNGFAEQENLNYLIKGQVYEVKLAELFEGKSEL